MTTLVVEQLETTLSQEFTVTSNRRAQLYAIRPYLYMHNTPLGTFSLELKRGSDVLTTKTFTCSDIQSDLSTANDYAHIYKALLLDSPVMIEKGTYTLELSASGYSFSESAYLGWIREYENQFYTVSGNYNNSFELPFSFQLFEFREGFFYGL